MEKHRKIILLSVLTVGLLWIAFVQGIAFGMAKNKPVERFITINSTKGLYSLKAGLEYSLVKIGDNYLLY